MPPRWVLEEQLHALGEQLRGGLVARHHELLHDGEHLGIVELADGSIGILERRADQIGEEVVARILAAVGELGQEEQLRVEHPTCSFEDAFGGEPCAKCCDGIVGPPLDIGLAFWWHVEHV
ncbi:unannotated protein [freshwater metagenome]|uniref:Unannotated protein n=1 Tax=freshwater metagenome TaxID=449393 RepID=A0A6J7G5T3_9ZZZZ